MTEPLTGAILLPDGTPVRGRGRREPLPTGPLPDFGLYLGRPPSPFPSRLGGRFPRQPPSRFPSRPPSRSPGRLPDRLPDRLRRTLFGRRPEWRPDWPADWIDWPDFRTPRDARLAAAGIERAYQLARAGRRVEVACGGGTGRTGTVIACMAVLAGQSAPDAVAWTRRHYRPRAVETPGQRRWIRWFATHVGTTP